MANMYIPEHINFHGDPIPTPPINGRRTADKERVMEMMNVPDRIVLTGGGNYQGYNAEPKFDRPLPTKGYEPHPIILKELPTHLTLADQVPYPDEPKADDRSQSSIAIDENPLQELKLMRRQVVKMSNRLFDLEEEMDTRRTREKHLWFAILASFAASITAILLRR